jgi:hypothetical protein
MLVKKTLKANDHLEDLSVDGTTGAIVNTALNLPVFDKGKAV